MDYYTFLFLTVRISEIEILKFASQHCGLWSDCMHTYLVNHFSHLQGVERKVRQWSTLSKNFMSTVHQNGGKWNILIENGKLFRTILITQCTFNLNNFFIITPIVLRCDAVINQHIASPNCYIKFVRNN